MLSPLPVPGPKYTRPGANQKSRARVGALLGTWHTNPHCKFPWIYINLAYCTTTNNEGVDTVLGLSRVCIRVVIHLVCSIYVETDFQSLSWAFHFHFHFLLSSTHVLAHPRITVSLVSGMDLFFLSQFCISPLVLFILPFFCLSST